jgi:hypothetical protein
MEEIESMIKDIKIGDLTAKYHYDIEILWNKEVLL